MKIPVKFVTALTLVCATLLLVEHTQAQALTKNTRWLKNKFNKLVLDVDEDEDEDEIPKFTFKGCQMNVTLDSKAAAVHMTWQLEDVRKLSYRKEKSGYYLFMIALPADKIKKATSLGSFPGLFNMDGKDKEIRETTISLNLDTKNELVVEQIKQKLEKSIQLCRQGND